jgi:hypothetical protein
MWWSGDYSLKPSKMRGGRIVKRENRAGTWVYEKQEIARILGMTRESLEQRLTAAAGDYF